jgi:DNA-binding MarR family transcriptional regulator
MHRAAFELVSTTPAARAVMDDLRRIVQHLRVSSRRAEQRLGISGAQLFVLSKLAAAWPKSLSVNELAEQTLTHQSSVSVVVARLVERGLVKRVRSSVDRRRLELTLTAAARKLLKKAPQAAQERLIAALASMSRGEQAQLAALMQRFVAALGGEETAPELFFEPNRSNASRHGTRSRR